MHVALCLLQLWEYDPTRKNVGHHYPTDLLSNPAQMENITFPLFLSVTFTSLCSMSDGEEY